MREYGWKIASCSTALCVNPHLYLSRVWCYISKSCSLNSGFLTSNDYRAQTILEKVEMKKV